jgi:hypothetical protein
MALVAILRNYFLRCKALYMVALALCALLCPSDALAQAVPWTKNEINSGSVGSFTYTPGSPPSYSITGSGAGVGAIDDSFCFVNTPNTQSCIIQGKVVSQTNTGAGAIAGFCIRNSLQTSYAVTHGVSLRGLNHLSLRTSI